jgi:hypothetical protein
MILNPNPTINAKPSTTTRRWPSMFSRNTLLTALDELPFGDFLALGELF